MKAQDQIKLIAALKKAKVNGLVASELSGDGGTCNHDAPSIRLPKGTGEKTIKALCKEAGLSCFQWAMMGRWVIIGCSTGQAGANTAGAEAACQSLKDDGFDTLMYCQMD